ncbi:DUF2800 domain-containing protein [Desulfosporosinus sp. Sb-LF]|uniref:DUF2800 domain-containing protein n=1 Tax=Desulfosporosinus sp. Sb-LF TaxID=2560027 RepID=UPI00107F54E2|nr:DUF2800 domain-containing protein [Desulfosporosinus sp. Sb-LF]TGE31309.1 DUF2800 domain-containing protein [Desulfosporosinus sp. Sb-LF]
MADHAKLSASSSHKWLNCTPSVRLEESFENKTSTFAEEGTAAHALSEHKLRKFLKIKTKKPISKYDSQELEFYTDAYVDYVSELISESKTRSSDSLALVEQRLDYSQYAEDGFGTGDLVIVSDGILDVIDLKYGKGVRVSAEHNTQMMLYALGALELFNLLYDIETVRMTICQPRLDSISTFELSVDELMKWAETELKPRAALAFRGEGDFISGEHCRFCRAKSQCRERANSNLELAKLDFRLPELLTDDETAKVLAQANELKSWAKDVWEFAEKEALAGRKKWPGYKLIEGVGRRKYTDEAKVAEQVLATGDFNEAQIYTKNLLGITAMTQLLGKKQFKELLGGLCIAPPGKPSLVVESDKHQEWNPLDAARSDFADAI